MKKVQQVGGENPPRPDGTESNPVQVLAKTRAIRASGEPNSGDFRNSKSLWAAIRNRTEAISFENYSKVINKVLCAKGTGGQDVCKENDDNSEPYPPNLDDVGSPAIKERRGNLLDVFPTIYGVDAYNLLKLTTQAFLLFEAGVAIQEPRVPDERDKFLEEEKSRQGRSTLNYPDLRKELLDFLGSSMPGGSHPAPLPYLQRIVNALLDDEVKAEDQGSPFCKGLLQHRFTCPSLLELIWSYWHEEGMLVQTMNAICMRFQNRRGPADRDPLANLELDPLRPLNNLMWGYIQDEYNRLTIQRRAYEYDHHYGMKIIGKAVPELRSADSRSKFIEAFHNLLYRTAQFYREDADTNIIADGFPLLNSLREVHILLAEGAHNQFGDLPWTSRAEMLMMEWLIARPEMREFLRGRAMVPYHERWMGQVDTMKKLQGWTDTSITHFRNLGVYGEQLLLAVRYGDWVDINDQEEAKTWARYWRPEIQGYIHAYLAATGVDLSEDIVDTRRATVRYVQPAILLQNRLAAQGSQGSLTAGAVVGALGAGSISFSALPSPRRRALKPAGNE